MSAFFSFSGRIRRTKFVLLFILLAVIQIVFYVVLIAGAVAGSMGNDNPIGVLGPAFGIYLLFSIIFLVMLFGLTINRLHDCGWSGFWSLLHFVPVPLALFTLAVPIDHVQGLQSIHYLPSVFSLAFLLVLALAPPSPGANRFGPNPRGPDGWREAEEAFGTLHNDGGGADWGDDAIERALKERQAAQARDAARASSPAPVSSKPAFGRR